MGLFRHFRNRHGCCANQQCTGCNRIGGSDRVVVVIDRDRNDFSQNCRGHWHY